MSDSESVRPNAIDVSGTIRAKQITHGSQRTIILLHADISILRQREHLLGAVRKTTY